MDVALRPMGEGDLAGAQALTAAVRWPHRVEDWRFVLGLGAGVVAESGGRILGTALAWRFGGDWASTGMVVVADEAQGRGLGRRLMDAVLAPLGDRAVMLHATEAGAPLYRRLGFAPAGRVTQYQGIAAPEGAVALAAGEALRAVAPGDLDRLATLDADATGMARGAVIAALLAVGEGMVLERGGVPCGFALVRDFGRGRVIGPVVAPDAEAAQVLIADCIARHPGAFLRIDVPEAAGLSGWVAAQGLVPSGGALRMIRGGAPAAGAIRSFALVNQALS